MTSLGLFVETRTCDGDGLVSLKASDIVTGFQVTASNPLVGVTGRTQLLNSLGEQILKQTKYFPSA